MRKSVNEIVGIYPGSVSTELCILRKKKRSWRIESLSADRNRDGGGPEEIRNFLNLAGFSKKRRICIGLPREEVFMREVSFPNLSEEQALSSARLGIGLYCHLKQEDIYHDEWVFMRDGSPCVIIAYTLRRTVDSYIEAIEDAGYSRSQITVAPATVGLDILIREYMPHKIPCVASGLQGGKIVVSLHGKDGWAGAHFVDAQQPAGESGEIELLSLIPLEFRQYAASPAFYVNELSALSVTGTDTASLDTLMKESSGGDSSMITWGLCAAAVGLSRFPALVFQEGVRKRPFKLDISGFKVTVVLLAVILSYLTGDLLIKVKTTTRELVELQQQETELSRRLGPLKSTLDEVEGLRGKVNRIKRFVTEYPMPLKILKALAETTPKSTWIKNFNFRNGRLRLSAEGGSAIDTMQAWRKNPLFSDVKLTSPVTKNRDQQDRFTVDISLAGGKSR